jgi:hypothetical protein
MVAVSYMHKATRRASGIYAYIQMKNLRIKMVALPCDNHQLKVSSAVLPAREEPFKEHLPQLIHNLSAYTAWLFDLLRELYGK